ncbi:MraY family glycosyltransferase [Acinetobacter baumannii]|uniref:MraY family glycosyltransferase n=1 Tax=Acinetobacter baumannii TaxID=470 RepID=UPI001AECA80E|nr:glycosyltransferase family 4 protein [Acinetobacter baumannii]MBP2811677.1 glycosyltransferase family 4 protein [Acinetobacter baumannii]MCU4658398.1 glycosyltransferase family 4 protein [Acinetobacter baumannii]
MNVIMSFIILFLISFVLTFSVRKYALRKNIIDLPNFRSSHVKPTPRGGGVAIVISVLMALLYSYISQFISLNDFFIIGGSCLLIALLGFCDDHAHINSMLRLSIHFITATFIVFSLDGFAQVSVFNNLNLGFFTNILAILFLVWLLNLYNFMDGINGIASIEAISVGLSLALLYSWYDINNFILLAITSIVCGFLVWNFPKAKIFMGDVGSSFLGFLFAVLALYALKIDFKLFLAWIICLGVFIVDATFTIIRRILRGEKIYQAHRSHAYQYAARYFDSHTPVTLAVLIINLIWLLPCAFFVLNKAISPLVGLIIAYFPLIILAIYFNAGQLEHKN